jgi:4-hydroxythreonine-4-phosphate dehydrogenase
MSPRFLILADDLSGAADCALSCLNAGLDTVVALDGAAVPAATALAIDTDSRRLGRTAAAQVNAAMLHSHAGPDTIIYKKMDSTLRGHFAAELESCLRQRMQAGARPVAIVAPAFPGAGRTTRGGRQYVNGAPVETTAVWRNENLAGRAELPAMLAAASLRVAHLDLASVRGSGLAAALRSAAHGHEAISCDAETDADLAAIAAAGQGLDAIWSGSAGLAQHLPAAAGLSGAHAACHAPSARAGAILCAVGSLADISRVQFNRLAADPGILALTLPPDELRAGEGSPAWHGHHAALRAAIDGGRDIAVLIDSAPGADLRHGLELVAALGRLLAPYLPRAGGLIATGGETARALLLAAGVPALRLAAQVEPGVPLSYAAGGAAASLPVITKAGAFGDPETLRSCRALLRERATPGVTL